MLRYLAGLFIVLVFYLGPALLVDEHWPQPLEAVARYVRYGLLGWAVAFLGPWIFVRLRLAEQASDSEGDR